MATRDETVKPSGGLIVGFKELLVFAAALVILIGGIVGGMQWVVTSTAPLLQGSIDALRQDIRSLDSRVDSLAETVPAEMGSLRSDMNREFKAVRTETSDLRNDMSQEFKAVIRRWALSAMT